MKAVIYARYSSDNQREESIEGQIRECTAFAEKNGVKYSAFTRITVPYDATKSNGDIVLFSNPSDIASVHANEGQFYSYVGDYQGESGVESAVVASAAKVDVVDGDFVITAPASINAVSVYNIAGQLINTAAVDGTTTVDGASLAQGVYILKFNDGSSVKVVK